MTESFHICIIVTTQRILFVSLNLYHFTKCNENDVNVDSNTKCLCCKTEQINRTQANHTEIREIITVKYIT